MKIHSPAWLLGSILIICGLLYAGTRMGNAANIKARRVSRLPVERNEPLRLRAVRVRGEKIRNKRSFTSDDDWLKTLTITIRNVSRKRVLFASIDLVFFAPPGQDGGIGLDEIDFGNRELLDRPPSPEDKKGGIAPDQEVDIHLNAIGYDRVKQLLTNLGYSDTREVKLKVGRVIFADDTSWYGGDFKRDANDPHGWINSELTGQAKPRVIAPRALYPEQKPSLDSSQNLRVPAGLQALIVPASYPAPNPRPFSCMNKSWWGSMVCYWVPYCSTPRELTDTSPGSYVFQNVSAMCADSQGDYCGMGNTTIGIYCSTGGGGGSRPKQVGGGYDGNGSCYSDFDCDFGYSCGEMFDCEEDNYAN